MRPAHLLTYRVGRRPLLVWGAMLAAAAALLWLPLPGRVERIASYADCAAAGYPITESNPPVCHGPKRAYVGPEADTASSGPALVSQPFTIYVTGDSHSDYPERQLVITNQADWEKFWADVHTAVTPRPPILSVDFNKLDVIAVSAGRQQTDGYSLRVTAVLASPAGSSVNVVKRVPTLSCPVNNTATNPYLIVTTAKLPAPVSFYTNTDPRHCGQ
ncbi:MAG TPA: protease complex subunit PrcB family protein [Candidatus Saccharimonadia bacterium]